MLDFLLSLFGFVNNRVSFAGFMFDKYQYCYNFLHYNVPNIREFFHEYIFTFFEKFFFVVALNIRTERDILKKRWEIKILNKWHKTKKLSIFIYFYKYNFFVQISNGVFVFPSSFSSQFIAMNFVPNSQFSLRSSLLGFFWFKWNKKSNA